MTINDAIVYRIKNLLKERNITQYRLEQNSGVSHNTMSSLMGGRYKTCKLHIVVLIIRGFGMTVSEFFNDPIFESEDLELE
ncbi:MAG: helix-turn-helix transcriptional regulator [Anaeroplasma bactoclasticum]|nr:helix-turn-helix transcriptional regulator [Anaeroplasma bactoclasticum]